MTTPTILNNRYRVISLLGSGGFGETFLAEDTHMPSERKCVIKQLKPVVNQPQIYQLVKERFQREAAILEQLGDLSNQIPSLYAYFCLNGEFYLVQEWIEGETLTEKVQKQGVLSESAVREILVNLLPLLEYVHNKHIVHRDIKPDNIIVRYRDNKPVLIDFGAVRESMGTVMNSQGNPTSSIVIGTPGYMPSEQAMGRPIYASDIYSLGITAIYLLTGKQPQEIETDPRTGEIMWHQYAKNLSPTMRAAIDKAIQYSPRDRYPTAQAMLEGLQPSSSGVPQTVPAQQQRSPSAPVAKKLGKNIIAIAGGSIFAFIVLLMAIATLFQPKPQVATNNRPSTTLPNFNGSKRAVNLRPTPRVIAPSPPTISSTDPFNIAPRSRINGVIEQLTEPNAFINGVWRLQFSSGATRHDGVLLMKGKAGLMSIRYFNSQTNRTETVLQRMRLWSSTQGLILRGHNPIDSQTRRPHPTYSPDEFFFQRRPDGTLYADNCDAAGNCSAVRVQFVSQSLNPNASSTELETR
ncbi:serine/threonine-protein kinase [Calothrix sp. NIES-2098]|uniref:serine/threonine-protein kinase n=1 Tax=Calothrix sp. NIES-2098 TaxID=1954171 RepID=UPI000B5F2CE2|nr:serine/threonine kinase [Calothrix sp. NIES-2098]